MKSLIVTLLFSCCTLFVLAQKPEVDVYEKKDGNKTLIMARNTGKSDYKVKITIHSEGMDVIPSNVVEVSLPGGFMKEMATITPRPGETWSYSYDVAITRTVSNTKTVEPKQSSDPNLETVSASAGAPVSVSATPELSDAAIILYAKPGCSRCTYAQKQLNSLGIAFVEINTHSDSPEVPNMWSKMREQGFTGGSVTMPVIRVKGTYHYDIKDLGGFIQKLKS